METLKGVLGTVVIAILSSAILVVPVSEVKADAEINLRCFV